MGGGEERGGEGSKWDQKYKEVPNKKSLVCWDGVAKQEWVWEKSGYGILTTDMAILEASISPSS